MNAVRISSAGAAPRREAAAIADPNKNLRLSDLISIMFLASLRFFKPTTYSVLVLASDIHARLQDMPGVPPTIHADDISAAVLNATEAA
jgi:hypothetical protein